MDSHAGFEKEKRQLGDGEDSSHTDLFAKYVRPKIAQLLALMKMDVVYHRGQGENLYFYEKSKNDPAILEEIEVKDFLGGYGTQLFGHSRSELQQALEEALQSQIPFQSQASIKHYTSLLAQKLDQALSAERRELSLQEDHQYISTFTNSGAESVEASIKLALSVWKDRKDKILHKVSQSVAMSASFSDCEKAKSKIENLQKESRRIKPVFVALKRSFHGKTSGALAMTANTEYSSMFERSAISVVFLDPEKFENQNDSQTQLLTKIEDALQEQIPTWKDIFSQTGLSPIVGLIYEPIQAEGGICSLSQEFLLALRAFTKKYNTPLIADEIQTGWMRCGHLVYSHQLGVVPDVILLGKALGGGTVKSGVMMASEAFYTKSFGFKHTSTFAEDETSSYVMLAVTELVKKHKNEIQERAKIFENRIRAAVAKLQSKFPGIITEVRGAGFLIGIEFNDQFPRHSFLIHALFNSGFGTYFLSSYLLNKYRLRLGVTLSSPLTLRIEPNYEISQSAIDQLEIALDDLCACLYEGRTGKLTAHLWKDSPDTGAIISYPVPTFQATPEQTKICFLCHLVSPQQVKNIDPVLKALSPRDLGKVLEVSEVINLGAIIDEAIVRDKIGNQAHYHAYGFFNTSKYFEELHRKGDPALLQRVQDVVTELENAGHEYIGLGQFTSIVTWNGLGLKTKPTTKITTGNSLTVATTVMSVEKIIQELGKDMKQLTVGVVGVTGNVCSVVAEIMLEKVNKLKLFYRDHAGPSERFKKIHDQLKQQSRLPSENLIASTDLNELSDCDLIIVGTNATSALIFPHHLKQNAVIVDISVPTNVHSSVLSERKDVICFSGGLIKLPENQQLMFSQTGLPPGEVFACLAETLMMALLKVDTAYSYGPLTKSSVERAIKDFKKVGYELGQRTYMSALL